MTTQKPTSDSILFLNEFCFLIEDHYVKLESCVWCQVLHYEGYTSLMTLDARMGVWPSLLDDSLCLIVIA